MIAQRNGRQIGNLLARSFGRGLVGGSIRCTGSVCEPFEALRARLVDRSFLRLFEMPRSPDRKSRADEDTKNRDTPRPEDNRATGPPRVSEDLFVLRRTSVRDKRTVGSEDFSSKFARKFENGDLGEVRAGPRPPTFPPPHPGGPCPPPPPDSSSGCGYCPPCPPRSDICPPASPPGGRDPKNKYPPCLDRPESKDSSKCPSNRPSPCGLERVPDKPCGPAKCPDGGDPKSNCPTYSDRSRSKDSDKCLSNHPSECGFERVPDKPCRPVKCPDGGDPKSNCPPNSHRSWSKDSDKCISNRPSAYSLERVPNKLCGPAKCPDGGDPKSNCPPYSDRSRSKDSDKCLSNHPSECGLERVPDKPCGPAKCHNGDDQKSNCPPYSDRSRSKDSDKFISNRPSACGFKRVSDDPCGSGKGPDGGDQKPKYPPCPDPPKSKNSGKCPSNGPSPSVSERVSDKPYGPAKCPEDSNRKKCPPSSSIKENPMCGLAGLPFKPVNRGYACSSRSDKRDSEGKPSRCGSKTGDAESAKSRDGAHEKLESYTDGRVICVKPGRRKNRGNSSRKTCGKKSGFSDDSKSPRRSFSSGLSLVRMFSDKGELRDKTLSTKRPKPGPACEKKDESEECEGTKSRAGKGYRRKMMSSECEDDNLDRRKSSKTENGKQKKFDPCGQGKSS